MWRSKSAASGYRARLGGALLAASAVLGVVAGCGDDSAAEPGGEVTEPSVSQLSRTVCDGADDADITAFFGTPGEVTPVPSGYSDGCTWEFDDGAGVEGGVSVYLEEARGPRSDDPAVATVPLPGGTLIVDHDSPLAHRFTCHARVVLDEAPDGQMLWVMVLVNQQAKDLIVDPSDGTACAQAGPVALTVADSLGWR